MEEFEEALRLSKAMSDINRMQITALIQREGTVCVCEVCDTLKLSQPLVSRHLKQLKEAGVVDAKKEGKWVVYSLVKSPSKLLNAYLEILKPEGEKLAPLVMCQIR